MSAAAQVNLVYDTSELDKLVAEYEKLKGQLTDLVDDWISKKRRGKPIKAKPVSHGLQITHWSGRSGGRLDLRLSPQRAHQGQARKSRVM